MLFEQFERNALSHYSYAVGCPADGRIAIVDPQRDVDFYLQFAHAYGVRISHVLETHIHADYASGARELAELADAELCVSGYDEGEQFEVRFPHRDLREGDTIELGSVRIEVLHTPGHTPEHVAFLVWDLARTKEIPQLMLSGDFLFVGSVGRPDLLGEGETLALAGRMQESITEKLRGLPDGLEIHPAHGAGSMCGSGMSGRPISTLGFERIANPYLAERMSKDAFVEKLIGSVPPFPEYYRRMKRVNSAGPKPLGRLPGATPIDPARFRELVEKGHAVIDLRDQASFGAEHVPGSFGIGLRGNLSGWAAWVVPYDTPILLVVPDSPLGAAVHEASRALVRVGLDDVVGYLDGGMQAWLEAGLPATSTPQLTAVDLGERLRQGEELHVIDVRGRDEWEQGHIEGAEHVPGGELQNRLDRIPKDGKPMAIVCGSGYRSTVAASVLERHGFKSVRNLAGGMNGWRQAGLPVS
ncbi:MAG: rhodanese-like domain-containing protein [Acidobacteriota bacterium]|nr:rhodanese-like domain-containing protein [Acidobacteriota bacterium]